MKLGIGSCTYMWSIGFERARPVRPMTAFDLLERARQLGMRVVQSGPNLPLEGVELERLGAEALQEAGFVFLAVPDALIGQIARGAEPRMKPGAMMIMLDAAAA